MDKLEKAITSLKEESWHLSQTAMELSRAWRARREPKQREAAWDAAALLDAARRQAALERELTRATLRVAKCQCTVVGLVQRRGASEASRRVLWVADFAVRLAEKVAHSAPQPQDDGPWAA